MLKKILPLVFLAALVAYGVYEYVYENSGTNQDQAAGKQDNNAEESNSSDEDASAENAKEGFEEGNKAPDFKLKTLKGKSVKLSDYRGKTVLINFWATWCPPCRVEAPELQSFYEDEKDNDFTILGVDLTSTEKHRSDVKPFVDDKGLEFPILMDSKGDVMDTYNIVAYPTSFFVDKDGIIQDKVMGALNKEYVQKRVKEMK